MGEPTTALAGTPVLFPKGLNVSLYLDVNHFARRTAWAHGFMHTYALWLGLALLAALFLATYGVLWWRRQVRDAAGLVLCGAATVAALGLNQLVGHAARELRPYATLHHVLVLVGKANDYAFPSDHAVVAGGLAASILIVLLAHRSPDPAHQEAERRRLAGPPIGALTLAAVLLGLFLCFARVYAGAHYPGDVVAGFLLGGTVVAVVALLRPVADLGAGLVLRTSMAALLRRPWPADHDGGGSDRAGCDSGSLGMRRQGGGRMPR